MARRFDIHDRFWLLQGSASIPTDFVFTTATTGAAETFTIPCQNVGVFDATIDWGDGSSSTITAYNDADLAHVYADAGTYTVTVSGTFPNVYFYGNATMAAKVQTVESLGQVGWVNLFRAFRSCVNMTSWNGAGDTSAVTTMREMLQDAALAVIDVSGLDTSSVSNMRATFAGCSSAVGLSVGGFDVSGVFDFAYMFFNVPAQDLEIDGWDVSTATGMPFFLLSSSLPTARYDATLIAWEALSVQPSVNANFGGSTYTLGGAAEAARSALISSDLWTITDGGGL